MEITMVVKGLFLWLVLGGVVAMLVCPLLKDEVDGPGPTPASEQGLKASLR